MPGARLHAGWDCVSARWSARLTCACGARVRIIASVARAAATWSRSCASSSRASTCPARTLSPSPTSTAASFPATLEETFTSVASTTPLTVIRSLGGRERQR
jgi:hypothetical protein